MPNQTMKAANDVAVAYALGSVVQYAYTQVYPIDVEIDEPSDEERDYEDHVWWIMVGSMVLVLGVMITMDKRPSDLVCK